MLFYNKDLFDAAGLAYPTADWTWADEQAAAEKLTDSDAGVSATTSRCSFYEFYKALAQAGGEFFDADGKKATFNTPGGRRGGRVAGRQAGHDDADARRDRRHARLRHRPVQAGKLAMWHTGIWQFTGLNERAVDWDIVVEPGNTQKASAVFTNGVVASAGTEHPDEAAAAGRVPHRLADDGRAPASRRAGSCRPSPTRRCSPATSSITPPANRQAVFDSLDDIALPPVIERQQEMQDIVTEALERIVVRAATDPQQALDDAGRRRSTRLPSLTLTDDPAVDPMRTADSRDAGPQQRRADRRAPGRRRRLPGLPHVPGLPLHVAPRRRVHRRRR